MIKVDIVNKLSKIAGSPRSGRVAVDAVFDAMRISMQRGQAHRTARLRVFRSAAEAGIGQNPHTRQGSSHPARPGYSLKPGKDLRISAASASRGFSLSSSVRSTAAICRPIAPCRLTCPGGSRYVPVRDRVWLHALLLTTFVTTSLVGASTYIGFVTDLGMPVRLPAIKPVRGLWYASALSILGAHEMGTISPAATG